MEFEGFTLTDRAELESQPTLFNEDLGQLAVRDTVEIGE